MKQFFVTILALIYLASVTGVNLHMHFCMGELVSWQLNKNPSQKKCIKCGMSKSKGCCEDKHKFVRVEKDQKGVEASSSTFKPPVTLINKYYCGYTVTKSYNIIRILSYNHGPPDKHKIPIYISNCDFRV